MWVSCRAYSVVQTEERDRVLPQHPDHLFREEGPRLVPTGSEGKVQGKGGGQGDMGGPSLDLPSLGHRSVFDLFLLHFYRPPSRMEQKPSKVTSAGP